MNRCRAQPGMALSATVSRHVALYVLFVLGITLAVTGCDAATEEADLVLALRTDLVPGAEFDAVQLFVAPASGAGEGRTGRVASADEYYLPGKQLAVFEGLPADDYRVEMILARGDTGQLVAERPALVTLSGNTSVTLPVDRSCLNVVCPPIDNPSADESELTACLGGQCVSPRCTIETPEFCGALSFCGTNDECRPEASCASGECALGVCWFTQLNESSCDEDAWCHPALGCRSVVESPEDRCSNGVADAGETGVDCGGECQACEAQSNPINATVDHCIDGEQNTAETGIDCGGECTPCLEDTFACSAQDSIPTHECLALVATHEALHLAEFSDWLDEPSPCSWSGIACSGGHVTEFTLPRRVGVYGSIPAAFYNLRELTDFKLEYTKISGTLSPELGRLQKLEQLFLDNNRFGGTLPPELGELESITSIVIGERLTGTIPPELGDLSSLEKLNLAWGLSMNLSGTIPPELGRLTALEVLGLGGMLLEGTIPESLTDLRQLRQLSLYGNSLSGEVPQGFRSHPRTIDLDLFYNLCLWTTDCTNMKPWLDQNSPEWSDSYHPSACDPPPDSCQ